MYNSTRGGTPNQRLGRAIYKNALAGRRGFRDDQLGIFDDSIWADIFENMGAEALKFQAKEAKREAKRTG